MHWIEVFLKIARWVPALLTMGAVLYGGYLTATGFLPAIWRLGKGLRKREIAIFAKGDEVTNLKALFEDSKLFKQKNIRTVTQADSIGAAEGATVFLIHSPDWTTEELQRILSSKRDRTALVVYVPQSRGRLDEKAIQLLEQHRNVTLVNFRGRLLNDVLVSMITTGYE